MDPGDLIAGYAAVVASVALGWQILKERRARRPQVEVKISYSLLGYPDREAAGAAHIEARNRGDMPVRVTSAGFELQDDSEKVAHITHQPPGATLPGVIGPRDSGFTYLLEDALGPLDPFRPLVGFVGLSTGERVRSRPTTLLRRLVHPAVSRVASRLAAERRSSPDTSRRLEPMAGRHAGRRGRGRCDRRRPRTPLLCRRSGSSLATSRR